MMSLVLTRPPALTKKLSIAAQLGRWTASALVITALWSAGGATSRVQAEQSKAIGPNRQQHAEMVEKGIRFLAAQQAEDGSFSAQAGIGPTALVALAMLENGRTPQDPVVARTLKYLETAVQQNGAIHFSGSRLPNYETCAALMVFQAVNNRGQYDDLIRRAGRFIRGGQWDEAKEKDAADVYYGGAGYGGSSRPDLSNTAFLMDALKASGAGPDDEAMQKALIFVSRCQNLETEHNTTEFAAKFNDGGFYYTPVVSRQDEAREGPQGGLRSYGAMTYAGFKSMLYAGLTNDDPRVKAAQEWISKHYDVDTNPGMGDAGLYYYYHTFAKALDAWERDLIEDASGQKHDWRNDLTTALAKRQQPSGSWVNENNRWFEGDANLATAFALLSLAYCQPAATP